MEHRGYLGQRDDTRNGQGRNAVDVDQIGGPTAELASPSSPLETTIRPLPDPSMWSLLGEQVQRANRATVFLKWASGWSNGANLELVPHRLERIECDPRRSSSR